MSLSLCPDCVAKTLNLELDIVCKLLHKILSYLPYIWTHMTYNFVLISVALTLADGQGKAKFSGFISLYTFQLIRIKFKLNVLILFIGCH